MKNRKKINAERTGENGCRPGTGRKQKEKAEENRQKQTETKRENRERAGNGRKTDGKQNEKSETKQ